MSDLTRNTTLPDTSAKSDFHNLIDTATVQKMKPATDSTTALQLQDKDGNAILNVDTTNDRVGMGTTTPAAKLEVVQSANIDTVLFDNNGTQNGLYIKQDGILAANKTALYVIGVEGTNQTTGYALVAFNQDDADSTIPVLQIDNDGSVQAISIDQGSNAGFFDFVGTASASVLTPLSTHATIGALGGFIQAEINGTKKWIPYYADPSA